jgi:glyoxylate utilization-related uncharacterized protein
MPPLKAGTLFERKLLTMAQYKIQRAKGVEGSTIYTYTAPGHNECVPTRLHDPADVDGGKMIQGITYFVPGGGCDYGANPLESIYYILEGQMTLKTEDGETVLHEGDSFHCCGGCPKSVTNNGTTVTKMLVCLLPPQA